LTDLPNKTELEEPENLIPYSNNPKEHPEAQIDEIASSIKNYGFVQPVVVDSENEVIIGHGRLKAAKKLGLDEIPVIKHDDITDSEAKALRLADNKIAESDWEDEKLAVELEQLTEADDYEDLIHGFDEDEMSEYLDSLTDEEDLEEPETEDPETIETDIQEGEVFKLGRHRLMCGDATSDEDVETLMDGSKADMVFTDPPYGIDLDTDYSQMEMDEHFKKEKNIETGQNYKKVKGDENKFDPIHIFQFFDYCEEIFLWGADYYAGKIPKRKEGAFIVWDKREQSDGSNLDSMFGSCFELCWSKQSHKREIARIRWAMAFGTEKEPDGKRHHPTQKPVNLSSWFIEKYSEKNDKVIDIYAGSGSTLLAAEQTDRKAYCMELDPQYCQVIINRWEDLTGKNAEPVT